MASDGNFYQMALLRAWNANLRSELRECQAELSRATQSYEILYRQWREQQLSFNRVREQELSDTSAAPSIMDQYSTLRENHVKAITTLGAWDSQDVVNTAGWSGAAFLWVLVLGAIIGRIE